MYKIGFKILGFQGYCLDGLFEYLRERGREKLPVSYGVRTRYGVCRIHVLKKRKGYIKEWVYTLSKKPKSLWMYYVVKFSN